MDDPREDPPACREGARLVQKLLNNFLFRLLFTLAVNSNPGELVGVLVGAESASTDSGGSSGMLDPETAVVLIGERRVFCII